MTTAQIQKIVERELSKMDYGRINFFTDGGKLCCIADGKLRKIYMMILAADVPHEPPEPLMADVANLKEMAVKAHREPWVLRIRLGEDGKPESMKWTDIFKKEEREKTGQ